MILQGVCGEQKAFVVDADLSFEIIRTLRGIQPNFASDQGAEFGACARHVVKNWAFDAVINAQLVAAGTPVDDKDYQIPFKFTGKIDKLTIVLEPPKLTPEDVKKLQQAEARQAADK